VVTKVTYKTHPAITQIVGAALMVNYTASSYTSLLKTWFMLQPALAAHNVSGYTYPTNVSFFGQLLVHNSADVSGLNATLKPLYDFVKQEKDAGRDAGIGIQARVLPDYMSMFPASQADEGSGIDAILGSRLLPMSTYTNDTDRLAEVISTSPGVQFLHGKSFVVAFKDSNQLMIKTDQTDY
jgi:hypothetical protein